MNTEKVVIPRGRRASPEQKGALLSYLEDNINFAHERFESDAGVNTQQEKWQDLSTRLNAMGGALKSPEQWKQYWRDFKRNVKAKAAEEKRQIEASGVNGIRQIKSLDEFERRTISIMTVDVIDGDGVSQERGFSNLITVSYQEVLELGTPSDTILEAIPKTSTSNTNNEGNNTTERRRRRGAVHRLGERRRRTGDDVKINRYFELEKTKIELKREIFEYQKQLDKNKLAIETKKADALLSMSESLRDMKHLMQNHNE